MISLENLINSLDREETKRFLDEIREKYANKIILETNRLRSQAPKHLFHYTTAEGLLGILEHRSIRATHNRFLNDISESEYGMKLISSLIQSKKQALSDEHLQSILDLMLELGLPIQNLWSVYSFSLSANGDQLSQWMGYGGGGRGYCIEFDTKGLVEMQYSDNKTPILFKIVYDSKIQTEIVNNLIDLLLEITACEIKLISGDRLEYALALVSQFVVMLQNCLACFKSDVFKAEDEYRLVCRDEPKADLQHLQFYLRNSMIVPCHMIKPGDDHLLPLETIIPGAGPVREGVGNAVYLALSKYGYKNVKVINSTAPLRC
jgi:hypothetical protein